MKTLKCFMLLILYFQYGLTQHWDSDIIPVNNGRLTYISDENRNRIPDYSYSGYHNGEKPIPLVNTEVTISTSTGDQTSVIQAAIDQIAAFSPDNEGIRGAVYLEAGQYLVEGTLNIEKGGIIIRGAGDGKNPNHNTILYRENPDNKSSFININSNESWDSRSNKVEGSETNIADDFIQVGSRSFTIENASGFSVGDNIVIEHPDSEAWLQAVDYGGTGSHPDAEPWASGEVEVRYNRYIQAINGDTITVDAPVFMHLDKSLSQPFIYKTTQDKTISLQNVGVEKLRMEVATKGISSDGHSEIMISIKGANNFWIDQVTGVHFNFSLIKCNRATRGTIMNCQAIEPHASMTLHNTYNYQISDACQLILLQNNFSSEARVDFTFGGSGRFSSSNSGNVCLNNIVYKNESTSCDNHVRWYNGNLFDNIKGYNYLGDRAIFIGNRGHWSGQGGYTSAFSTAWNCEAQGSIINVQGVPTAQNYAIGCIADTIGNFKRNNTYFVDAPEAYYEGNNTPGVFPQSIYLAQLKQRLDTTHKFDMNDPEFIPGERINIYNGERSLSIGYSLKLFGSIIPANSSDKKISWKSSDTLIATVNKGLVSGIAEGTICIIAYNHDSTLIDSTEISVTSFIPVAGIELNPTLLILEEGQTDSIKVLFDPEDASNVNLNWESDDPSVATVDNGLITGISEGSTYIRATSVDGDFTASSFIIVNPITTALNKQRSLAETLQIYPNPLNEGILNIKTVGITDEISFNVIDAFGRTVYSSVIDKNTSEFNLSFLPAGSYFVEINLLNKTITRPIIIN